MKRRIPYGILILSITFIVFWTSSYSSDRGKTGTLVEYNDYKPVVRALLASRYSSLDHFNSDVELIYFKNGVKSDTVSTKNDFVQLKYDDDGNRLTCGLRRGISQNDISLALKGSLSDKLYLLFNSPYAIRNRKEMNKIYVLARRLNLLFGEGDVAFFDLALTSVQNINTMDLAYKLEADSSEKGFLNTFNHVASQAFITSCYSERMAEYIGDVHERKNMAELVHGVFSEEQLTNPDNNPVDNYVDIINNRLGQKLGKQLSEKYGITSQTEWSPELLANYLNDIQAYYCWSFGIGMKAFQSEDDLIIRFAKKINMVATGVGYQEVK